MATNSHENHAFNDKNGEQDPRYKNNDKEEMGRVCLNPNHQEDREQQA